MLVKNKHAVDSQGDEQDFQHRVAEVAEKCAHETAAFALGEAV